MKTNNGMLLPTPMRTLKTCCCLLSHVIREPCVRGGLRLLVPLQMLPHHLEAVFGQLLEALKYEACGACPRPRLAQQADDPALVIVCQSVASMMRAATTPWRRPTRALEWRGRLSYDAAAWSWAHLQKRRERCDACLRLLPPSRRHATCER